MVSLTNETTTKSMALNISGPATIVVATDGTSTLEARGGGLYTSTPSQQAAFGLPPIGYATAFVRATLDPTMNPTSVTIAGGMTDVCALLG